MNTTATLSLKILLPFAVLLECSDVTRLVAESSRGFFGIWPHRLDCAAVLVPGILTYQAVGEVEQFVALDQGVLVKTGLEVVVATRYAELGADLGSLRELVEHRCRQLSQAERTSRSMVAKIESEIIRETAQFSQE